MIFHNFFLPQIIKHRQFALRLSKRVLFENRVIEVKIFFDRFVISIKCDIEKQIYARRKLFRLTKKLNIFSLNLKV
jgi:hypothetical protein